VGERRRRLNAASQPEPNFFRAAFSKAIDMTRISPMNRLACAAALACFAFAPCARANVDKATADGFFLTYSAPVAASATKTYGDIVQISRWWDAEHTYSGKSSNLTLKPEAGGCFCEKWKDGSAEHGRVVMALPGKLLRLDTALGPLQERALNGTLSFWIKSEDSTTTLTVEYRVNGASNSGLDQLAPSVDEVLGAQIDRLRRYIATGNPEAPPDKDAPKDDAAASPDASAQPDAAAKADAKARPAKRKTKPPAPTPAAGS
jgi:hypothetical protein